MTIPVLIKGNKFNDERGSLNFNNNFDMVNIKRCYEIKNCSTSLKRGWKGHKIEKRWFLCSSGEIQVSTKKILTNGELGNATKTFELREERMDVLYVPPGYATQIQQVLDYSRVLVFADYYLGVSNDENLRW